LVVLREFTNNAAHGAALCGKVDAFWSNAELGLGLPALF